MLIHAEKCKNKIETNGAICKLLRTIQLEYTWLRSLMNRHQDFWRVTEDGLDKSMKVYQIDISMKNELLDLKSAINLSRSKRNFKKT